MVDFLSDDRSEKNVIRLKLRKPTSWNWELTTSKSSSDITFPRLLLYDSEGNILVDVQDENCIFQGNNTTLQTQPWKSHKISRKIKPQEIHPTQISNRVFDGIVARTDPTLWEENSLKYSSNDDDTNSEPSVRHTSIKHKHEINSFHETSIKGEPKNTIFVYSEKGLLKRDLNSKEFKEIRKNISNINEKDDLPNKAKTKIDCHIPKNKFRNSKSCDDVFNKNTASILKSSNGIHITTDSQTSEYFLRKSRAGILILRRESSRDKKFRRRAEKCTSISETNETDEENVPSTKKQQKRCSSLNSVCTKNNAGMIERSRNYLTKTASTNLVSAPSSYILDMGSNVSRTPNKELCLRRQASDINKHIGLNIALHNKQINYTFNSTSEKETTSNSCNISIAKANQGKPDIQLKLPLLRSNFDPSCDQGYGSERSPEEEAPHPIPMVWPQLYQPSYSEYNACNLYLQSVVTKDSTFHANIAKGPRGLGLSIFGGIDSNSKFPGLIRIKKIFPNQSACITGLLQVGDIILEANNISLTGMTSYEALEVLRTIPNEVVLLVCRPENEQFEKLSPPNESPKPPHRTNQQETQTSSESIYLQTYENTFTGEFEITIVKIKGSLGFTLHKEDESLLGHYIRALVREPATTDGRIKPGDKIIAVNDVPLAPMTHEEAVIFLRQAADTVKLRLYRDESQIPVASISPTNSENKTICGTFKKASLRPEAVNLLTDLAYKKQIPHNGLDDSLGISKNISPRGLKRGNKCNGSRTDSFQNVSKCKDLIMSNKPHYSISSQSTLILSDSDENGSRKTSNETLQNVKILERPNNSNLVRHFQKFPFNNGNSEFQYLDNELELRKLHNKALNVVSNENYSETEESEMSTKREDYTSLPCETFLIACKTESDLKNGENFNHKNLLHKSASVKNENYQQQTAITSTTLGNGENENKNILKWKGVVFSSDEEELRIYETADSRVDEILTVPAIRNSIPEEISASSEAYKVITVELNRGWNNRLGFSLQSDPLIQRTIISAVYSDSVAARDGRLKVGDQLISVSHTNFLFIFLH